MRRRSAGAPSVIGVALLVVVGLTALTVPASAQVRPRGGGDTADAVALLTRAVRAAHDLEYGGSQYVASWRDGGQSSLVVDVLHLPGQGSEVRVHETAGTRPARVFDADRDGESLADLDSKGLTLLRRTYQLSVEGKDAAAGRSADVVVASRRDGSVAGRFWLDGQTGLLLRRDVLDAKGRMVRSSAFIDVRFGAAARSVMTVRPPTDMVPAPWDQHVPVTQAARLRAQGWNVPARIAEDLQLFEIRMCCGQQPTVLHLSYTDGLSTLSVFEEHGHLDTAQLTGWRQERIGNSDVWASDAGSLQLVWPGPRTVFTVLADAAPDQVRAAVSALPHAAKATEGILERLWHGLQRIASWLNPFD